MNLAHTPGATGHAEAHVRSLPNRKRIHSVITHEAEGHDGDTDVSEADNDDGEPVSTVGRNITVVDGSRIFEQRSALGARRAAFANARCRKGHTLEVTMTDQVAHCEQCRSELGLTEYVGYCSICLGYVCSAYCDRVT